MMMKMSYTVLKSVTALETLSVHFILRVISSVGAFISPLHGEEKPRLRNMPKITALVRDKTEFEPCHWR